MTEGMKSSEMIVTLAVMAIIVLNSWLDLGIDEASLWAIVTAGVGYSGSRGIAKVAAGKSAAKPKP